MAAKAILIGCAKYENGSIATLRYPEHDAEELSRRLVDPDIGGYIREDVRLLRSPDHKTAATSLARTFKSAKHSDSLLFYFAGHGLRGDNGLLYLAVADSDPELLEVTSVPAQQVRQMLDQCRSRQICVILDCCFSGAIGSRAVLSLSDTAQSVNTLTGEGTVIITASQPSQEARERADFGHGVFTKYVLQGLDGEADANGDGIITPLDLYSYVALKMEQDVGRDQRPTLSGNLAGGSFPLVRSASRSAKALNALRDEVKELCRDKRHVEALALLDAFRETRPTDRREALALRDSVASEMQEVVNSFRAEILAAAGRRELSDATLRAVLERISHNPDILFVERPDHVADKLLRNYLLGRLDARALEATWPHHSLPIPPPPPPPPTPPPPPPPPPLPFLQWIAGVFRRPAVWLALVAIAFALWIVLGNSTPSTGGRLKIGVLAKDEVDTKDAEQFFAEVATKLASALKEVGSYRPVTMSFATIGDVVKALEKREVDLVGELSPRDIYAVRAVGAEPFIQSRYEDSETYKSLIVVSSSSPLLVREETGEIKPRSWRNVLESLQKGLGTLAVSDKSSTSGYWFPRSVLLNEFGENVQRSFEQVSSPKSREAMFREVACETGSIIAGVEAEFRFPKGHTETCGEKGQRTLVSVKSGNIQNGGFVVSAEIARNHKLVSTLKNHWANIVSDLGASRRIELKLPSNWGPVDWSNYEQTRRMIEVNDDVEGKPHKDEKLALVAAVLILLLGVAAYYRLRLHQRRKPGHTG